MHSIPCAADLDRVLVAIGEAIAKIHDGGLVHGDLTTSNLMVRGSDQALVRAYITCLGSRTALHTACNCMQIGSRSDARGRADRRARRRLASVRPQPFDMQELRSWMQPN